MQTLEKAKSNVLVQAYSFTLVPIAEALAGAHQRGIRVQVLLDKSQRTQKSSVADLLIRATIPTRHRRISCNRSQQGHDRRQPERYHRIFQLFRSRRGQKC